MYIKQRAVKHCTAGNGPKVPWKHKGEILLWTQTGVFMKEAGPKLDLEGWLAGG